MSTNPNSNPPYQGLHQDEQHTQAHANSQFLCSVSRSPSHSSSSPLPIPPPSTPSSVPLPIPAEMALAPSFTPTMVNSQSVASAATSTTTKTALSTSTGTAVVTMEESQSDGTRSGSVTRAPSLGDQGNVLKKNVGMENVTGREELDTGSAMTEAKRSLLNQCVIVLTVTSNMIINTANSTAMSIALPTVEREWHLEPAQLQWMMSAYPLSSGCLFLVCGRLADVYGRKRVFLAGAAFLAIFTLACGFAEDIITLDILRGIQGVGAAATIPASLGILAQSFPPSRARSLAFATFSAGAPIGAVFGTAIGGILTEYTTHTWRSSFYLLAALTALVFVGGWIAVDADVPSEEKDKRIDWIGAGLVTSGLVFIVFVLGQGEVAEQRWATGYIIALLIIGVILVGIFLYWQHYLEVRHNVSAGKRFLAGVPVDDENGLPLQSQIQPVNSFEGPPTGGPVHCGGKPGRSGGLKFCGFRISSVRPFISTCPNVCSPASTQLSPGSNISASHHPAVPSRARSLTALSPTLFQRIKHNLTTPPPLMKLSIWTRADGRIAAMMAIAFTNWCAFMSWTFWVQLYYQNYLGYGPMQVVVRLLPMFVSGMACNVFVGLMAAHVPVVWLVGSGAAATTLACVLFAVIDPRVSYWGYAFTASVLSVMGADFVFSAGTLFISKFALPHEQSVAGALFNTMTQLGTAVGVTVTTVIYNSVGPRIHPGHDNLLMYRAAQWGSFAFGCIATTLAIVCFIGVGVVGHKGEKPIDTLCEKEEGGCRAITSKSYALAIEMDADPKLDHEINEGTEKRGERQRVSYGGSIQEDELITPPGTPTTGPTSAPVTPPRLQH